MRKSFIIAIGLLVVVIAALGYLAYTLLQMSKDAKSMEDELNKREELSDITVNQNGEIQHGQASSEGAQA
jgi:flagellar basal body-associated protein FliL